MLVAAVAVFSTTWTILYIRSLVRPSVRLIDHWSPTVVAAATAIITNRVGEVRPVSLHAHIRIYGYLSTRLMTHYQATRRTRISLGKEAPRVFFCFLFLHQLLSRTRTYDRLISLMMSSFTHPPIHSLTHSLCIFWHLCLFLASCWTAAAATDRSTALDVV